MSNNQQLKIVIVGGVAGGASAATKARRANANAKITILEKGPAVSFANCGLPYHLGGEIEDRDKLLVATAQLFWDRFRIHVRTGHEVLAIDRKAKFVAGKDDKGAEFNEPYDKLILATGSEPIRPSFWDAEVTNAFHLWTLRDMDSILSFIQKSNCRSIAVIGAGFVGLEVVEQLAGRGMHVTLVERLPQVLGLLDVEMARLVEEELIKNSVKLRLGTSVASWSVDSNRVTTLKFEDGDSISTDLVIVGAGVRPRVQLAQQAGLELGQRGVRVNNFLQTNDPDIYAVGDMIEYQHAIAGSPMCVPLAGPANRAGRIAGAHAASSQSQPMGKVLGTSIVRVFGITAGSTGLSEAACRARGMNCRVATIQAAHHASYFPGAKNLTLKLIYDSHTGKLLGAQAVGAAGVDKRIDVAATVMHFGGTVHDLAQLDLAYAPPFGSAKDPIHLAAFVAENDLAQAPRLLPFASQLDGKQVVDVRNASEVAKLPLPGAKHIPIDELIQRWTELDPTQPTVTVCHSGKRAHIAACWLAGNGFRDIANLNGGMSIRRLS